jgi:EthD domain
MVKVIGFFRRREGMSREDFIEYYETTHSKLAGKYLVNLGITQYVRRYLNPLTDWLTGLTRESGFDVIMELWFKDQASFDVAFGAGPADPAMMAEFETDQEKLFDRSRMCYAVVDEHESRIFSFG